MNQQLRVEQAGDLIIARLLGQPTEALLSQCQEQVLELARRARRANALYDTLRMQAG